MCAHGRLQSFPLPLLPLPLSIWWPIEKKRERVPPAEEKGLIIVSKLEPKECIIWHRKDVLCPFTSPYSENLTRFPRLASGSQSF